MPHGTGGKAGGGASPLVPQVLGEFLSSLVSSIPVDAGLGWGWEAPRPARCFDGLWEERGKKEKNCRKSTNPGGKTPKLEEEHQTCPQEGFFRGDGDGEAVV